MTYCQKITFNYGVKKYKPYEIKHKYIFIEEKTCSSIKI